MHNIMCLGNFFFFCGYQRCDCNCYEMWLKQLTSDKTVDLSSFMDCFNAVNTLLKEMGSKAIDFCSILGGLGLSCVDRCLSPENLLGGINTAVGQIGPFPRVS